ncbi:hypothetical protein V6N12_000323 [Hibiscus sabdariffa]|uniref:Uncharacterized protein n=1 Tax=Hibiscus sabdariffa TaxID=183260 RepID=A0ABR2AQ29_9ROSI
MAPIAGGSESVINESSLMSISDEASEQAFSNKRIMSSLSPEDLTLFRSPSIRVMAPLCVPTVAPNVEVVPCPDVRDTSVASSMDTIEPHVNEVAPSPVSLSTPIHDPVSDNIEVPPPAAPAAVEMVGEDVSQNDVSSSAPECVSNPCADICHDSDAGTTLDSVHNSTDALGPDLPVYSADVETNINNRLIEEVVRAPANVHPMSGRRL